MNPIEQAIDRTEGFLARLDWRAARAAMRVTTADTREWRERWLGALGMVAQRRETALNLLRGLKAIQYRPEVQERPGRMLKMSVRVETDERKRA